MRRHPVMSFLILAIVPTWALQFFFLFQGWDLMPAKLAELVILLAAAVAVSAATGGRPAVRRLFARAVAWRFGPIKYALVLLALPVLTLGVAAATGRLRVPPDGWAAEAGSYLFLTVVFGALLANVWEELAWAGLVQTRLAERHGLVRGALLTAIPFALIHLPLAFEESNWALSGAVLVATAPVMRYLIGLVLRDTGGSVLAVGLLHASFNASGNLGAVTTWWPVLVALALATVAYALVTATYARLDERGYASVGSVSTLTR